VKFVLEFLLGLCFSVVCLLKRPDQLNQRHNFTKLHKNATGILCPRFLLYSCKTCNVTLYPIFSLETEYKEVKQNPTTLRSATAKPFSPMFIRPNCGIYSITGGFITVTNNAEWNDSVKDAFKSSHLIFHSFKRYDTSTLREHLVAWNLLVERGEDWIGCKIKN